MNKILQLYVILIFLPILLMAQVEINGTLDLSVSQGGKDSRFITNELANEFQNLHMSIHQLNLFVFAQVTDDFFVNVRLQWDTWGTGKLNREPRLSLAVPLSKRYTVERQRIWDRSGLSCWL